MDIPDERDMRELEEAGEKEKELKDEELDKIYGEFNPEDPRFREMLDDRDLLYIDGLECGDLVAELKDKIAGSYVVFAKAGIRFSPKSSAEIRRCCHCPCREEAHLFFLKIPVFHGIRSSHILR